MGTKKFNQFDVVNVLRGIDYLVGYKGDTGDELRIAGADIVAALQGGAGRSVSIQYSATGNSWHYPGMSDDQYMQVRMGSDPWSPAYRIAVVDDGTGSGTDAAFVVQYSLNGTDFHDDYQSGDVYIRIGLVDGTFSDAIRIIGEKGDKGDKGDKGETGAVGATGAAGATGATGAQGNQGYTPYIINGNWWIDGQDTGYPAVGGDGTAEGYYECFEQYMGEHTGQVYISEYHPKIAVIHMNEEIQNLIIYMENPRDMFDSTQDMEIDIYNVSAADVLIICDNPDFIVKGFHEVNLVPDEFVEISIRPFPFGVDGMGNPIIKFFVYIK